MNQKIKTRFAPSPTGYLHIGGLRTALYNYLYAKQNKGRFVLRIEDTDQKREVKGAAEALMATLQKMGLNWDEGPKQGFIAKIADKGQNGPYFQSKRLKIYQNHAQKLVLAGQAYYCTCSPERLEKLKQEQEARKEAPRYDGCCREKNLKSKANENFVIRLKVPENKEVVFNDLIRGEIKFKTAEIDDQVLIKSDGFPTYHLANVVDDHLMGITHVIRGEEWLPSTPKHILLYEAFGWPLPQFSHLPLLLNADKSKLSKRQGDVAVEDYLAKGYLPQAIINYVALLGWHPSDNKEIFSLPELVKAFDLNKTQKAGAIFDIEKLNWFNAYYIKQLSEKELLNKCREFLPNNVEQGLLLKILKVEKERLNNLSEIGEKVKMFLELPAYNPKILIFKKSNKETTVKGLELALEILQKENDWQKEKMSQALAKAVGDNNLTNGDVFWPVRVAVSGLEKSPAPEEIMWVLGKEKSLKRIQNAIEKLKLK
ncbi:MAG: glutamate--tRNA ligase [Candidatus Komeilibacteria bacterium]|nr:glutamate--tRNA ligase [Candidatus Komeilibacteria bacterium]